MLSKYKFSEEEKEELVNSMVYLIDTREKKNDHITMIFDHKKVPYEVQKLDYGDYSFYIPKNEKLGIPRDLYFDKEVIVERKATLEELSQNLTKGRASFEKELARAPAAKMVMVETQSFSDLVHGRYETQYAPKYFIGSIFSLWHRYNCPFVFIQDERDSAVQIRYFLQRYLMEQLR